MSPETVIWLAHALEALFRSEPGQSQSSLLRRASSLLGASPKQAKMLKKNIAKFYALRSSFVHGGLKIVHPLHNDLVDDEVEDTTAAIMDAADFAALLLVASIQQLITNNWKELEYVEQLQAVRSDT